MSVVFREMKVGLLDHRNALLQVNMWNLKLYLKAQMYSQKVLTK